MGLRLKDLDSIYPKRLLGFVPKAMVMKVAAWFKKQVTAQGG
jgi:hypothetical protein